MLATFPEGESKGLEKQRKTFSVGSSRQLPPMGKARDLKNKERPLRFAEADSFPVWEAERAV